MDIRIRKAKSGKHFKFKYRISGIGDVSISEAKMMVRDCNKEGKDIMYSKTESLSEEDFLKGMIKIDETVEAAAKLKALNTHVKKHAPRDTKPETGKRSTKGTTVEKAKKLKGNHSFSHPIVTKGKKVPLNLDSQIDVISSVNARVGSGNGQYVILQKLKQMNKGSINQIITEILRDDIKMHGIDYVLAEKGWQYYPNLKKNVAVMKRLNLLTVVDRVRLDGMVRMEEILKATGEVSGK